VKKQHYFFLHFMPVPDDDFIKKPKLVAGIGQCKILSENRVLIEAPFAYLSINPLKTKRICFI
jgi:hypothetical protein